MRYSKPPLAIVKERFGTKDNLVNEVVDLLNPPKKERDLTRERLRTAANSKLLRLHRILTEVKEQFGSKEKLVEAILVLEGHQRDEDRRNKLLSYSPGRLLDLHRRYAKKAKKANKTGKAA